MGRAQRTKGHSFERKIAIAFRWIYERAYRGRQTQGGTAEAPDVDGTPFYIECKKEKKYPSIQRALKQAEEGTDGRIPLAITAKDRTEPIVSMRLNHFLWLCEHFFSARVIEEWKNGESKTG